MMCLDTTLRYEDLCRCLSNVEKGEDGREGARAQTRILPANSLTDHSFNRKKTCHWIQEEQGNDTGERTV